MGRFRNRLGQSVRPGILAAWVLALVAVGTFPTAASALEPCEAGVPPGEVVYDGFFSQTVSGKTARVLRKAGVRQRPTGAATILAGEQEFPVASVSWTEAGTVVRLKGGLRLVRGNRSVGMRNLRIVLRRNSPRAISGQVGSRELRLFDLKGTKLSRVEGRIREVELTGGAARLTGEAARLLSSRLKVKGLFKGREWSRPDLFVEGAGGTDLVGNLPDEPSEVISPVDAIPIESAVIEWRIRKSFVDYVSSGNFVAAVEPAISGPAEPIGGGGGELVYRFDLPLASGWVADETDGAQALVQGDGGVWFRHCRHTINFTLTGPELFLDGDSSYLVARAEGTDGTAYDGRRVEVLRLFPSRAEATEVDGRQTVIREMPAYVAEGAEGVFLSYPEFPGSFDDPKRAELSRFGSVTVTYTRAATG